MKGKQLLLIGILAGALLLVGLYLRDGSQGMWKPWNVHARTLPFADLRTITGASESLALGFDPLVRNPGDPWGRPMNYPRIWLLLSTVTDQNTTIYLGLAIAVLFFTGIILFTSPKIDLISATILLICVFSPAVLLGVERGNTDLFVFFLLSITIFLASKRPIGARLGALASMLTAFALKLFPLFAFPYVFREKRRNFFITAFSIAAISGAYLLLTHHDLVLIWQASQAAVRTSFGINVFWMFVQSQSPSLALTVRILSYAAAAFAFLLAYTWLPNGDQETLASDRLETGSMEMDAFRIGSGLYIGIFLLGSNWDYRLVFLLFVVPQLLSWAKSLAHPGQQTAKVLVLSILVSLWSRVLGRFILKFYAGNLIWLFIDEAANWIVFFGLAALLASTVPQWMQELVSRFVPMRMNRRRAFIILVAGLVVISASAVAYLMALPSSHAGSLVGDYSLSRLILVAGPFLALIALGGILVKALRNHQWSQSAADQVFGMARPVMFFGNLILLLAAMLVTFLLQLKPNPLAGLNATYIERLLPYLVLLPFFLMLYLFTYRLQLR